MHVKYRSVDSAHSSYSSSDGETSIAAMNTIENPEVNLLTQDQVFDAEGSWGGLMVQAGFTGVALMGLFAYRPQLLTYFRNAQLSWCGWGMLGGAAFAGHQVGHATGTFVFGNQQALHNHWVAYHFVKSCNRFEGRQILSKAGSY
jgi:hypothetical protein